MKKMRLLLAVLLLAGTQQIIYAQANKDDYKKAAAETRKEVWGWKLPQFNNTKIAAEYDKFSSVIIARHTEIEASSKTKVRYYLITAGISKKMTYTETERIMVKLNDKSALSKYSEISYTQFEKDKPSDALRSVNKFVGVRIIKPNGSINEVNTDEAVLTTDEKRSREAKLAIPGLEVGDILDFFIQSVQVTETYFSPKEYMFTLGDENPILSYSLHGVIGKRYAVETKSINKAPEIDINETGDDVEISFKKENMPAFGSDLWTSVMRQVPVARLRISIGNSLMVRSSSRRKKGEVLEDIDQSRIIEDVKKYLAETNTNYAVWVVPFSMEIRKLLGMDFKERKDYPRDSMACFIYYYLRWKTFYETEETDKIYVNAERNYFQVPDNHKFINLLRMLLEHNYVETDVILVTSKYGPENSKVFQESDYELVLKTHDAKPLFFTVDGVFTNANYLGAQYEGQKAPMLVTEKKISKATTENVNVPATHYTVNNQLEKIAVSFKKDDLQQLQLTRNVTEKGHMKIDDQKRLLLFEDYYEQERVKMGFKKTLQQVFEDRRRTRKLADEYEQAFTQARKEWKEQFEKEVKVQFGIEPKNIAEYKVIKTGIRHHDPVFEFTSSFTLDGLVKKAGNNFIVDAGKLIGSQLQLEEKQRTRTLDVYMPFARSLDWEINIDIPEGYTAEGIDKLNNNIDNDCAFFKSEATLQGNKIVLKVSKAYKHSFEPVANWQKLVDMIDAAQNFSAAKILLKKKA
jgi:Domain of Unknown Function with PDB structure (DUF3857)